MSPEKQPSKAMNIQQRHHYSTAVSYVSFSAVLNQHTTAARSHVTITRHIFKLQQHDNRFHS